MDNKLILTICIFLFLLTGCAVSDDPRQGGLLGYWHGTSSGKYEERRQQRLQQLEEEKKIQQQLTLQAEQYKAEFAVQDHKLKQEQDQILKLDNELTLLNLKIDKLQATNDQQRERVSTLRSQIQTTQERINNQKTTILELDSKSGSSADQNQILILQHERDRLADEYRKLNVYYQALSNSIQ